MKWDMEPFQLNKADQIGLEKTNNHWASISLTVIYFLLWKINNINFFLVPYLIDGDTKLTESQAILKYCCKLGNKPDMLGKTIDD